MTMSNLSLNATTTNQSLPATSLFLFALVSDVITGFLGSVGSIFVSVVVFSRRELRTPCFQLIAGSAIGSAMVAVYYFGRGIDKIVELRGGVMSIERTVLVCLLTTGLQALFGIPFHALITCLVGVDRTISLLAPIKYRTFGKRYVIYMLAGSTALVLLQEIVGFITAPLTDVIVCRDFPEALYPTFIDAFAAVNLFLCTAVVTVYSAMLICFIIRKRNCKRESSEYQMFMKQQSAAMPTVILMTVLYFLFGIMAEIFINVAIDYPESDWFDVIMTLGDFLKAMSSLVEVVSLMICSTKFRECARKLLGIKSNSVVVINITASAQSAQ